MNKCFLLSVVFAFILTACNKDQQLVRQLDGEWRIAEKSFNGQPEDPADFATTRFQFHPCKMAREDCNGYIANSVTSQPIKYSISEKGTRIKIIADGMGSFLEEEGDILEHSKSVFVMRTNNRQGHTTDWRLERAE